MVAGLPLIETSVLAADCGVLAILSIQKYAAQKRRAICRIQRNHNLRERGATSARLLGVRVLEDETLMHEGLLVIQNHTVQVDERFGIDEHAYVVVLKNAVTLTW